MKKITALLIALALILGLCACSATATWQEQYDLGVRYLSEGNYREAIIAFNAAIEIDPKRADAYLGLADVYEAQGDTERARQVLADALAVVSDPSAIQSRLDSLGESASPGPTPGTGTEPTSAPAPGTTPTPVPGATPVPSAGGSQTANTPNVTITATGIRADNVGNYDGYGRLKINSDWSGYFDENWNEHEDRVTHAQYALIDRNGSFVLPYQEDTVGGYYTGDAQLYYSDGIFSLSLSRPYSNGGIPRYFNLDGTPAFILEETETEYTDENGWDWHIRTSYLGGPMRDGYAVVIQKIYSSWSAGMAGGADGIGDNRTLIIDRNGAITCELPQKFNESFGWGEPGFSTEMSLGWCGEGLFAFFESSYDDETWTYTLEGKGYMDPTGKTVIDLEGRGFRNLGPFTNGLAWVLGEGGKYGYIDKTGALVIPCIYEDVGYFNDGFAYVQMDGKWGYIDKTGALVIPCIYENIGVFSGDGLAYVQVDGKWGYIDKTGKTVIPFEYDSAYGAGDGLAAVVKDGKCGFVDYSNNIVVPLEYDDVSSFVDGVAYGIKDGFVYIIS